MNVYHRKLYALLRDPENPAAGFLQELQCFEGYLEQLDSWWRQLEEGASASSSHRRGLPQAIADSSDRVNLESTVASSGDCTVKHPISGQSQQIERLNTHLAAKIDEIKQEPDAKKVFWWFWRFYPEILASEQLDALLAPAHRILPDCPLHSHRAAVSALTGALFPQNWESGRHEHPYLFLFTFSPVQEFIKSSRKFLDFWAGSYLLHYLSVRLCWHIATEYGPDAVITPSLWSQEIIDALIVQEFKSDPVFKESFQKYTGGLPVERFTSGQSTSLSTAGFPNVITALVPGKEAAEALGEKLAKLLREEWRNIAKPVREDIKQRVMAWLKTPKNQHEITHDFSSDADRRDLEKWRQHGCWEWNKLWEAQIEHTWETYWTAVPLGDPEQELAISKDSQGNFDATWKEGQEDIAPSRFEQSTPTAAEETAYDTLNVGTWWANVQSRLAQSIQSIKNTRNWQIPVAPGERSTLSGQYSAVHPNFLYEQFPEGCGVPSGSMRLFWQVMAKVYRGLFNGSEKLNAIELTKRMAWGYGGVAESLGIEIDSDEADLDYEKLIRFPNLSSIAAARFAYEHLPKVSAYWDNLNELIQKKLPKSEKPFRDRTRRHPCHVPKTDAEINPKNLDGQYYNGVMFSSKWLAEDMDLQEEGQITTLRGLVDQAHKTSGFGDGSPADWWAIVLADGDGMGKYVSGRKLEGYKHYIIESEVAEDIRQGEEWKKLLETRKRMGPATHVGLNRALLDFSNRLVPYLTEKRFCGKVVYSGGDDVMAVLPLADLPEFLISLRAAWCGDKDPGEEFQSEGGYWRPNSDLPGLHKNRPYFTMGEKATLSAGIVIAYKSVPLPTVLENLWTAEKERAKKIPGKDGLCFRVIYGGGNILEALMKGTLLEPWWQFTRKWSEIDFSPLLYRLAEELPRRAGVTEDMDLFSKAAQVILGRSETGQKFDAETKEALLTWLSAWDNWAFEAQKKPKDALGTHPDDLGKLLRFSAFWVDKMVQQAKWGKENR